MSDLRSIPIEFIRRRPDARQVNLKTVGALAESIAEVGLVNPIRVRHVGEGYELIAGSHRLSACDSLEHREIAAFVVGDDDLHAELAMIDENLCRAELSPADRASQTARRKVIYEALHPSTMHGANLEGAGVANLATPETERFTSATAKITGLSERAVQRDAERGQKIDDDAINLIRGTALDRGIYLDEVKRVRTAAEQVAKVQRDLKALSSPKQTGIQRRFGPPTNPDPEVLYRNFVKLIDALEEIDVASLIVSAGRNRSILGQRASGLADRMSKIMEGLSQ